MNQIKKCTEKNLRIYFMGSHSVGKTTLARYIANHYGIVMITEIARQIATEMEKGLDNIRISVDTVNEYQTRIFRRQYQTETEFDKSFVCDRSIDCLVYNGMFGTNLSTICWNIENHNPLHDTFKNFIEWLKEPEALIFFVRPHKDMLEDDGHRAKVDVNWDNILAFDGAFEFFLEYHGIRYINVEGNIFKRKINNIKHIIDLFLAVYNR